MKEEKTNDLSAKLQQKEESEEVQPEEEKVEPGLRPLYLKDFLGQEKIKDNLSN